MAQNASAFAEQLVQEFYDRNDLGGLLLGRGHPDGPAVSVPAPVARRIAAAGRHGVSQFAARRVGNGPTSAIVSASLLALALNPVAYAGPAAPADGNAAIVVAPRDLVAFAQTLLGIRIRRRLDVRPDLLPRDWAMCVDALPADGVAGRSARAAMMKLAACAIADGILTPDDLEPDVQHEEGQGTRLLNLERAAFGAGWTRKAVIAWRAGLGEARQRLATLVCCAACCGSTGTEALPACAAVLRYLDHLEAQRVAERPRTLAETLARFGVSVPDPDATELRRIEREATALGLEAPGDRAAFRLLVTVAPRWEPLLTARRTGRRFGPRGAPIRPATARNLLDTLGRLLAQIAMEDPTRPLHTLGPEALLRERVSARRLAVASAAAAGFRWLQAAVEDTRTVTEGAPAADAATCEPTVPWLQYLIARQAAASAARSPLARARLASERDGYTDTLINDVRMFGQAFRRTVRAYAAAAPSAAAELLELATVTKVVEDDLRASALRAADDPDAKQILRVLELVTWPQLCCVGLPWLRAKLRRTRRKLQQRPSRTDRAVERKNYLEWLECYLALASLAFDLMRAKNMRRARVGTELYFTIESSGGRSVVTAAQSYFADKGPAQVKNIHEAVWTRSGLHYRVRDPRRLRWSPIAVDLVLLQDYLELVRAPRLRMHGREVPAALATGVLDDLGATLPLFVMEEPAETDEYGVSANGVGDRDAPSPALDMPPSTFRLRFARALHAICREALGRQLPDWHEFKEIVGSAYYGAFTPHFLRHAATTYLLGARASGRIAGAPAPAGDVWPASPGDRTIDVAARLLHDTRRTLRRDYLHWTDQMAAHMRATERDWEHPAAYDQWMDLLLCGGEIDWAAEHGLPLPPGLTLQDFVIE